MLGPRLVIPGTLLGAFLLASFLYGITAGISLPPPVMAALPPTVASDPTLVPESQAPLAADLIPVPEDVSANQIDPDLQEVRAEIPDTACLISPQYPDSILQWCKLIQHYSQQRGLDPNLIAALIVQESGGNSLAYSKSGAVGLMQVMPRDGLASSFMCVNGPCFSNRPTIEKLQDPEFNIAYGTKMLAGLLNRHGNIRDALKSYGPMNVGYYYADKVLGIFQRYGN